jgi:hypothetical protein
MKIAFQEAHMVSAAGCRDENGKLILVPEN